MKLFAAVLLSTLLAGAALLADAATEIAGDTAPAPDARATAPDSAR